MQTTQQARLNQQRLDRLRSVRLSLATLSEAQNCAVLATTDDDAGRFAEKAAAAGRQLASEIEDLTPMFYQSTTPDQRRLWQSVQQSIRHFLDVNGVESSVDARRVAMLACQDTLAALAESIDAKPEAKLIPSGRRAP